MYSRRVRRWRVRPRHGLLVLQAVGAAPIITVNYGSATPALAAAWVQDANGAHNYGIEYWEVGNEVYGSDWETDDHSSKSPNTYADNFLQYQSAMRAVDPNIEVCTILTTPGNWPDGDVGPGDTTDWNHTVLSIIGSKIQCVIVHDYPGQTTPAAMLQQPASVPGWMSTLRSEIDEYAGSAASSTQILTTETDSNGVGLDSLPGALFTADTMMTMLEHGSVNVDYWDEHNGGGSTTYVDGVPDYNDEGMFSNGSSGEPAVNTPFVAPYSVTVLQIPGGGSGGSGGGGSGGGSSAGSGAFVSGYDSSKCMDDNNDSYAAGSKVQIWDCNGGPAQDWTVSSDGTIGINGNCLDIYQSGTTNGSPVETWTCNGNSNQQWKAENGTLVNPASGKCLDDPNWNTDDGTQLDIWTCNGGPNQKWAQP